MTKLKRFIFLILPLIIILPIFSGCSSGAVTLRVLHWADYINEGSNEGPVEESSVIEDFEKNYTTGGYQKPGRKIKVLFEVVEKPEIAAVKIEKGKEKWDVMCPSESVLERLLKQNLLKPINTANMPNYNDYISSAMKDRSKAVEDSAKQAIADLKESDPEAYQETFSDFEELATYSVGYMWGNFGILYNTEMMAEDMELLESWGALWNTDKFKGRIMMKNGPRESFSIGIIYVYKDTLMELYTAYENSEESGKENALNKYKDYLAEIYKINNKETSKDIHGTTYQFYRGNDLIAKVEEALVDQKNNAQTIYEMDDGKDRMVAREKYAMDMAWNGDAVWALGIIEEEGKYPGMLDFAIPKEGSNFWIDSWVIPKYSKNSELAEMFIDYMCSPEISIKNMEYVGYTSVNSSEEILKWAVLNSGNFDNPIDVRYFFGEVDNLQLTDEEGRDIWYNYDGNKFTTLAYEDSDGKLYNRETGNEIVNRADFIKFLINTESTFVNDIQYPSQQEYDRCGVMLGYSSHNDEILQMWTRVKGARLPIYVIVGLSVILTAAVAISLFVFIRNRTFNKKIRTTPKDRTPPKRI